MRTPEQTIGPRARIWDAPSRVLTARATRHRGLVGALTWGAAALMVASGAIHLHLYDLAYRHIPTIGTLFVLQGIGSILLALLAALVRRVWSSLAGAATMLATLAGFLVSVNYGLFGFQDAFNAPDALSALVIEIASATLFLAAAALSLLW